MTLFELAYSHFLYQQITKYDKDLNDLFSYINGSINLSNADHVYKLLVWLNKWGCRHISKEAYTTLIAKIQSWWNKNEDEIVCIHSDSEKQIIKLFDSLSNISINKSKVSIHFGSTAAAKTLFVINKNVFIPWDNKIREKYENTGKGYYDFLYNARGMLDDVYNECNKKGLNWQEIIERYFSVYISDLKLVDEYFWVTKTKNLIVDKSILMKYIEL